MLIASVVIVAGVAMITWVRRPALTPAPAARDA
jgi:hypothetical protein